MQGPFTLEMFLSIMQLFLGKNINFIIYFSKDVFLWPYKLILIQNNE